MKTNDYIVCLKCRELFAKKDGTGKEKLLRKCPNCGAGIKYLYLLGVVVDRAIELQREYEESSGNSGTHSSYQADEGNQTVNALL